MTIEADAAEWLDWFADLVRARDTSAAEPLFHPECTAYGTRRGHMVSRAELVAEQWTPIWHSTEGFHFLAAGRQLVVARDGSLVVAMACWASDGIDEQGCRYPRRGRATIVLEPADDPAAGPDGAVRLVARHSHFSEMP